MERLAFEKEFPDIEQGYVSYLIDRIMLQNDGSLNEAAAETSALFSTGVGSDVDTQWGRDYYYQKYFPKTISAISRHMNIDSNLHV